MLPLPLLIGPPLLPSNIIVPIEPILPIASLPTIVLLTDTLERMIV